MNTASPASFGTHSTSVLRADLKVTAYDRVAGTLIALLTVVGAAVLILFTIWLTAVLFFDKRPSNITEHVFAADVPDREGRNGDMEEPGIDDLEDLNEPAIEAALAAITDVVADQGPSFDDLAKEAGIQPGGTPKGRPPDVGATDDGTPNVVPPWQRWEIQFTTTDIETYARQLDFFGIELGAVGGGSPKVHYAFHFAKQKPARRSGLPENEKRLYMTWRDGGKTLADMDRQLLTRAGVTTERRVVLQFYPKEVEKQLLALEAEAATGKAPDQFLKTYFAVRPTGSEYEFYVVRQTFRPSP